MTIRFTCGRKPLAATIAWILSAPLATHAGVSAAQAVDLGNLGDRGFRIEGVGANDLSGLEVSGAGDVNGDGLADVIVGANGADPGGIVNAGEAYVVFGQPANATVDATNQQDRGFRIRGIAAGDYAGARVSGAGDVNGDGLSDLIVGAAGRDRGAAQRVGEAYVVFGKRDALTVDLANLGAGGFRMEGVDADETVGSSIAGAGDVNGDGLADLIVGGNAALPGGVSAVGKSYVVFGKTDTAPVQLGNLGGGGFRLDGIAAEDGFGTAVSGAGDVNGDGLSDLVVAAPWADPGGRPIAGETYIVFGKSGSAPVSIASLGSGGFRIPGVSTGDRCGIRVAGAGDVNGDGLADVIISAWSADPGGRAEAGEAYVVFGKPDAQPVDPANLGPRGFRIHGSDVLDYAGGSVGGAGDVNGDGLADVLLGAAPADPGGDDAAGESYVVFGKSDTTTVELSDLGARGFRLDGIDPGDRSGFGVSGAGDVNGDGLSDLIVGAPFGDPRGVLQAGESYVVFSTAAALASAIYRARSAPGDAPRTAFGTSGDGSNDATPDARAWIDFVDGADPQGAASSETVTLFRSSGAYPTPGAPVRWRIETTRQGWTSAQVQFRYLERELIGNERALRVAFSPNGQAPFTVLPGVVDPAGNTIRATITQPGFFYIDLPPVVFSDGFESAAP